MNRVKAAKETVLIFSCDFTSAMQDKIKQEILKTQKSVAVNISTAWGKTGEGFVFKESKTKSFKDRKSVV